MPISAKGWAIIAFYKELALNVSDLFKGVLMLTSRAGRDSTNFQFLLSVVGTSVDGQKATVLNAHKCERWVGLG